MISNINFYLKVPIFYNSSFLYNNTIEENLLNSNKKFT
jgi:hypothetical protein